MESLTIFTEAGSTFGLGHFTRCLAIAQGFARSGWSVNFILKGDYEPDPFADRIALRRFDWITNRAALERTLNDQYAVSVVDSYHMDQKLCAFISDRSSEAIFLDDNDRLDYPPGSIVLNGTIGFDGMYRDRQGDIRYLVGPDYQPLREPFWLVEPIGVRKDISVIMITLGGGDIAGLTNGLVADLSAVFPKADIHVLLPRTNNVTDRTALRRFGRTTLHEDVSCEDILGIMKRSDVCISAGGQTLFELARVGLPTIAYCVIENQRRNFRAWQDAGFIRADLDAEGMRKELDYETRLRMSLAGRQVVDGQGVKRLIAYLMETRSNQPETYADRGDSV